MGQSQSQQCGICERTTLGVFNEDNFLNCHRCGGVYCMECAGLTITQFEQLVKSKESKEGDEVINWYCQYCVSSIKRTHEVSY